MNIPFTSQLLGDLIEKGYTYILSTTKFDTADKTNILLKAVRQKPELINLPDGYETFYKITREPLQLACGIDADTTVMLEYETTDPAITGKDVFDDRYFRMSEDFFEQVLDSLEDYAVITTDKNGDINSWNSGAERVLGYKEAAIIGLNARVFFTPEDVAKKQPELELSTALKEGRAIDERYHLCADGTRFWGSGLVFPLYDEEHNHRGYTKIMRNLQERKNAERSADK